MITVKSLLMLRTCRLCCYRGAGCKVQPVQVYKPVQSVQECTEAVAQSLCRMSTLLCAKTLPGSRGPGSYAAQYVKEVVLLSPVRTLLTTLRGLREAWKQA